MTRRGEIRNLRSIVLHKQRGTPTQPYVGQTKYCAMHHRIDARPSDLQYSKWMTNSNNTKTPSTSKAHIFIPENFGQRSHKWPSILAGNADLLSDKFFQKTDAALGSGNGCHDQSHGELGTLKEPFSKARNQANVGLEVKPTIAHRLDIYGRKDT